MRGSVERLEAKVPDPAKLAQLRAGISDEVLLGRLIDDVGADLLDDLLTKLKATQLKALADGLGGPALKRVASSKVTVDLANLATVAAADLRKLSSLRATLLGNLSKLPSSDISVIAKLDAAMLEKIAGVPSDALKGMSPLSEAALKSKVADLATEDGALETRLTNRKDHLRNTNFIERGGVKGTGGETKAMIPNKAGTGLTPVPIPSTKYIRLEPIPVPLHRRP